MNYLLFLILMSTQISAAIINFNSNGQFKASELNHNFNEIKTILNTKNVPIQFDTFSAGALINRNTIEGEFRI